MTIPAPSSVAIGVSYSHGVVGAIAPDLLQFFEVVPQRFESSYLQQLQQRCPLLLRDSIGNLLDAPDAASIAQLRDMREELQPMFIAEAVQARRTEDGRTDLAFPLAPLYTGEILQRIVDNAHRIQNELGGKLVLENAPRFFRTEHPEITPADFFSQLVERTGCGLALDLSALILDCEQDGRDVRSAAREFPLDRVVLIRLTGIKDDPELRAHWIAPVATVNPSILALLRVVADLAPNLRGIIIGSTVTEVDVRTLPSTISEVRKALS